MQNRRDFLKTATLAALGSGLVVRQTLAGESSLSNVYINKLGLGGKMKMSFFPYELKLKHVFTVATYSRTTTPDVQVEIEYEGITGYGEARILPTACRFSMRASFRQAMPLLVRKATENRKESQT